MKVLVVEDDRSQAQDIEQKVRLHLGAEVSIVGPYDDFQQVLPHIKSQDIHLALIDIQLHDDRYAGIHIAEMIQELMAVPIIFISGITDREVIERADKVTSSDFLQKPFDESGFQRALQRALQKADKEDWGDIKVAFKPRGKDKYWIKTDRSTYIGVDPKDIICVESIDQFCRFYVIGSKPLIAKAKLKSEVLETGLLSYTSFFLLNRSLIVNKNFIEKIDGNQLRLKELRPTDRNLLNQKLLHIPKEKKKEVFKLLGIIQLDP